MKTPYALSAFALAAGLAVGSLAVTAVQAQDPQAGAALEAGARLTIGQVVERLTAQGYRDIDEIERDGGAWEVDARTSAGERVKLRVDAHSGAILKTKTDARRSDRDHKRMGDDSRHAPTECGSEPCRTDRRAQGLSSATMGWYLSDIYARLPATGG